MPSTGKPSLWASQSAIARSDLVDVTTTRPFPSPEYIRSLSDETKTVSTVADELECANYVLVMVVSLCHWSMVTQTGNVCSVRAFSH